MEDNQAKVNQDILKRLYDLCHGDLNSHIDSKMKNEMLDSTVRFTGNNDKEIVVNIRSSLYEKNEKGELLSAACVIENNFYIPMKSTDNHDEILKTFMDKLVSCLSEQSKEVSK
jgi:hypothetical protein